MNTLSQTTREGLPTLIFPDIHLKHGRVQKVMDNFPHNKVILLGDIFNDHNETDLENYDSAEWLCGILRNQENVVLWGNHDIQYRYHWNSAIQCRNCAVLNKDRLHRVLPIDVWDKTKLFHVEQGFLFSHAGFKYKLFKTIIGQHEQTDNNLEYVTFVLNTMVNQTMRDLEMGFDPKLTAVGSSRGGRNRHGGLTWCDIEEFFPIPNVKQIFGHSFVEKPNGCYTKGGKVIWKDFDQLPDDKKEAASFAIDCGGFWFASLINDVLQFHLTLDYL